MSTTLTGNNNNNFLINNKQVSSNLYGIKTLSIYKVTKLLLLGVASRHPRGYTLAYQHYKTLGAQILRTIH